MKSLSSYTGSFSMFSPEMQEYNKLLQRSNDDKNPDNLGYKPNHSQLRHVQPGMRPICEFFAMILLTLELKA